MKKRIAIVTGGSGGLGKEFVKLFLKNDALDEILIVARNAEKLEEAARENPKIRAYPMDVAHPDEIKAFGAALKRQDAEVRYLVNTAGYAKFGNYADFTIDRSLDLISVDCGGAVAMGLAALPMMNAGAKIVNIASTSAFQPLPYFNLYAASKAFLLHYTRALGVELAPRGITATAVTPGWMLTGLYDRAEVGASVTVRRFPFMTTPDRVAEKALKDAEAGKPISVYGISSKLQHVIAKLAPTRVMLWMWKMQQGWTKEELTRAGSGAAILEETTDRKISESITGSENRDKTKNQTKLSKKSGVGEKKQESKTTGAEGRFR